MMFSSGSTRLQPAASVCVDDEGLRNGGVVGDLKYGGGTGFFHWALFCFFVLLPGIFSSNDIFCFRPQIVPGGVGK